ncbi:hypothetical protein A6A08_04245 [Nocardiopsis sp. TSRI0078]|uniref:DUF6703 family protein n=1 Tax=unclassified Nocardiopsis TaxID=2649073 RepID=UPI00093C1690|nr:DUF6703 family protein [Nocardiopsis sp. TSRI0078]OKI18839.1 hypothetical protein A6A08_04245 [Nocardiopsis sp. TSRI0078]
MAPPEHGDEKRRRDPDHPPPEGNPLYTPGAGRLRRSVEERSAVPLVWLHQRPRWLAPLVLGALFIAGLMAPGLVGALCLLLAAAFLAWLAFLTWPSLDGRLRMARVLTVTVVLVLAAARVLGY